jgi:hypothetical protein
MPRVTFKIFNVFLLKVTEKMYFMLNVGFLISLTVLGINKDNGLQRCLELMTERTLPNFYHDGFSVLT